MNVTSESFPHHGPIPPRFAFGRIPEDPAAHFALGDNETPHLAWTQAPEGTRSFVVVCLDDDVPSRPDDVNREGRVVPASLPRTTFVHWVMVDVPAGVSVLAAGSCGRGVEVRGRKEPPGPLGTRQGLNDYTGWFRGDAEMEGAYLGYDGPCPPWNDEVVHRYHFRVFALDVPNLDVSAPFTWSDVQSAMRGHVLAEGVHTGTYTMNRDLVG
jgi:Raf kinase inhibitor-like YbhB/YbcL family protein